VGGVLSRAHHQAIGRPRHHAHVVHRDVDRLRTLSAAQTGRGGRTLGMGGRMVRTHAPDRTSHSRTEPSLLAVTTLAKSAVKRASLTKAVCPRNSFSTLHDLSP
jgi:hypothetical protein